MSNITNDKDLLKQLKKDFKIGKLKDDRNRACESISDKDFNVICQDIAHAIEDSFMDYYGMEPEQNYTRTYNLAAMEAYVTDIGWDGNGDKTGTIKIEDDAYHHSIISSYDGQYDVPLLMNYGYKDKSYSPPRFEGYSGSHMIDNALAGMAKKYKGKVRIIVNFDGNETEIK